jgi:predicted aspartyl protease
MNNVKFIEIEDSASGELNTHAIIDRGNNEYTSMPKSVYDEMIAAQSTPIDTEDE